MRLNISWHNIFPLWIYTRQGKWWSTTYEETVPQKWGYVVALSRTRHPEGKFIRMYPLWHTALEGKTSDIIIEAYDNWPEACEALQGTTDELTYIAAGWIIDSGDTLSSLPPMQEQQAALHEGHGDPPTTGPSLS